MEKVKEIIETGNRKKKRERKKGAFAVSTVDGLTLFYLRRDGTICCLSFLPLYLLSLSLFLMLSPITTFGLSINALLPSLFLFLFLSFSSLSLLSCFYLWYFLLLKFSLNFQFFPLLSPEYVLLFLLS